MVPIASSRRSALPLGHVLAMSLFLSSLVSLAHGQNMSINLNTTLSVGYILFPGFEPLDVFGPLEILYQLSYFKKITLATIAHAAGPISSRSPPVLGDDPSRPPEDLSFMIGPSMVATHSFEDAPALDVIIVPGGLAEFAMDRSNDTEISDFLVNRSPAANYVLSVCTGAISLARAGLLAGHRATTNKAAWSWATSHGSNITWVPSARWVQDGKIWTSSGVAAGMDMMYEFLKQMYGTDPLDQVMNRIEYAPHTNPHWDPFSVVHNVPGADKNQSLSDCTAPVGYS